MKAPRLILRMVTFWTTLFLITSCIPGVSPTERSNPTPAYTSTPIPSSTPGSPIQPAYWPTKGWRTSTPEEQGMDSAMLTTMLENVVKQNANIHSILIVRNGYVVLEAYLYPFDASVRQELHSCTKSVVSALTGIAVQKGFIQSAQQKVVDLFPGRSIANLDERKQAMTVEHLLTMSSGLEWIFIPGSDEELASLDSTVQMYESPDPSQFVLDRPMAEPPGTRFLYSNGTAHLLTAVLQQTTGQSPLEFAQQNLFEPLGISDVTWPYDPQGVNFGAGALQMTARDMARFGYLYLKEGEWDGRQIIPAEWVNTSLSSHIRADGSDYGYLWWIDSYGAAAEGWGGQYIVVVPDQQMVAVVTAGLKDEDFGFSRALIDIFAMGAIKSANALPENPEAVKEMNSLVEKIGKPDPQPVGPLPEIAKQISGKIFSLEPNVLDWRSFALHFDQEAVLEIQVGDDHLELPIGLDNTYRFTPDAELPLRPFVNGLIEQRLKNFHWTNNSPAGLKGFWKDDKTFVSTIQILGKTDRVSLTFMFEGDSVTVFINLLFGGYTDKFMGRLQDQ